MTQGLWRTTLAGPGQSLTEAFDNLERSPHAKPLLRHPERDLLSARVTLSPEEGNGYWELTRIRNELYVILGNFAYKTPRVERVPGDGLIQFNFKVSGDLTYAVARGTPLRFNHPSLHVWRQPPGMEMQEHTAPSSHERLVAISVRPEFLLDHFFPTRDDIPNRLQAFVSDCQGQVNYCQLPLTADMVHATTRLLDNPYTGRLALLYTEALAHELLCAAVGKFSLASESPTEHYSERHLRSLSAARQRLMEQFAPPPTIAKLSRLVGLGEKALTRGFKAVYGETLFDFSVRCRMQHALTLLRDRNWSVDRVSEAVGYSHPTSFATAFRRHFGLRPVDLKRVKPARNS
jgi:AraC-like DNA-binding protein